MNRRIPPLLTATAMTGALAISGIGVVTASSPPPQPLGAVCGTVPEGLNLIIPHEGGVAAVRAAGSELLDAPIAAAPNLAVRGPDGTVWVEAAPDGRFGVYRIPAGRIGGTGRRRRGRVDRCRLARRPFRRSGDRGQRRGAP